MCRNLTAVSNECLLQLRLRSTSGNRVRYVLYYTNGLPISIKKSKYILFADETTVFCFSNNLTYLYHTINNALSVFPDWCRVNTTKPTIYDSANTIWGWIREYRNLTSIGKILTSWIQPLSLNTNWIIISNKRPLK